MNAKGFIWQQVAEARMLSNAAMAGVTEEQFNWIPADTLNPIKAAFLHVVAGEDIMIQMLIQGKPPLWSMGGWGKQIGLESAPGGGRGWAEARAASVRLAPVLAYAEAVCGATNDYLAILTEEDLDRHVSFFGQDSTVAGVLARMVTHIAGHAGEIAAVKAMQGVMGLPF
jgi:hypothetical protein